MRVTVNGVSLWFDVDGAGLVPDGAAMRERPTLILLHGGPGMDHSLFKPRWSGLRDVAQVIYLDHRGNGRSDDGDPALWTLDQWGDDVQGFCEALGIERPIVCGVSFGGFVAQAWATRHAEKAGGLILVSTAARIDWNEMFAAFEAAGGAEARAAAEGYWRGPTPETRDRYRRICLPMYYRTGLDPDVLPRMALKGPVGLHFNGAENEMGRMDFRAGLARVEAPILILAGEDDPITPPAFAEAIHAAAPEGAVLRRYDNCGHGVIEDRPDALDHVRAFIEAAHGRTT